MLVPKITVLRAWDTLRVCSLAAASVACSALALANAALAKPTATVALANPAIVIAATVVSQSAAAVALAATAVALAATTIAIALAATAYATLSLAATVAAVAVAFAFAFAAAAQPAQSASAALATVEGHAAPLIRSRLIETVRSVCGTSWFSLRFCVKAPQIRHFFLAGLPPRTPVGPAQRFFTVAAVSGAHFGSTTVSSVRRSTAVM